MLENNKAKDAIPPKKEKKSLTGHRNLTAGTAAIRYLLEDIFNFHLHEMCGQIYTVCSTFAVCSTCYPASCATILSMGIKRQAAVAAVKFP